jgi:hypothetical protein
MFRFQMSENDLLNDIGELVFQREDSVHNSVRSTTKFAYNSKITHFIANTLNVKFSRSLWRSHINEIFGQGKTSRGALMRFAAVEISTSKRPSERPS